MIPEVKDENVSRQEFIDLLCRMTKTDEDMASTTNNANESEITIIEDHLVAKEGEIIMLDGDEEEKKEMEDGEITESQESDNNDDVEELNLRLNALRSLAGAQKQRQQKPKKVRPKQRRSNDNKRYFHDDTDLRSTLRNRSSSRHFNPTSKHDDREYLLDKDYRQTGVFDRLFSLISPNHNRKLLDNYDIQQMDIVEDHPIVPPLPPLPPPPPPLPPSHLPFFDPLPPLPPPPPSIFNMFPVNPAFPSINWPRPNFLPQQMQTDLWPQTFNNPTDVDLRLQPISNHHYPKISPRMNEPSSHKKAQRRRSKKRRERRKSPSPPPVTNPVEISQEQPNTNLVEEDEEEERLLREQLLRTLSNKRKVKIVEPTINSEPDRIVTIVPSNSPPPPIAIVTNVNPTPTVVNKSQYSINQRYKRVKANMTSKLETTTTTTTTVVRTAQPIIQTRNKIVRVPDTDIDILQSNPIIITFDDPTTDEDEQQISEQNNESSYPVADDERQAIKRLQQLQEEVTRRANAIESTTKAVTPKAPTPVEVVQEAIPSTDELTVLFEKRRMLLNDRAKYADIQEKMKKKKLENGLFAREIERLEEQLVTKRAQITNNNALLQYWQKEALAIAQNIKQQEAFILQSAVFKSTKPTPPPVIKPLEFDYENISKIFDENNAQLLLSILICPLNLYQKLRSYHTWLKTVSHPVIPSPEEQSCLLLRTRSFPTQNEEQYWKTSLQAYFIDINQVLCPYELQGSCKAQHCIYQHQHQITSRIDQFLSSKNFEEKNKLKILNRMESLCSLQTFDVDLSILEKKIAEKQYQRCRIKLDRYLSIYHEDFRYFRDRSTTASLSTIHPILVSVSNQLDSDDFSPERAVADLVEGLESQRTNAQLWCLYLELSSWQMPAEELHHLCNAAIKNAQSYDLFWTVFYLCTNNLEEFISTYFNFIQSDPFDFHSRSFAICELAMFHASLAANADQAYQRIKNYLSNSFLKNEHRLYLVLILLYIFAFGSFPRILYLQIDQSRFIKSTEFEPFICPWSMLSTYAHSQTEIDRFFDDLMNPVELAEGNVALYINKIHYFNATKRFEQSKVYIETLIEAFPGSIELWIEYLVLPGQNIPETLDRARKSTGIYYEFVYSLSSSMDIKELLNLDFIPAKTSREKFFFDLLHETNIEPNLLRYNGELQELVIIDALFHLPEFGLDIQRKRIVKMLNYLIHMNDHQRILLLYSFFRILPINRVLDVLIDCLLFNHIEQFEWIFKSFTYRLLDCSSQKDRSSLLWFRFDAFAKQFLTYTHCQEIYVTILQRLIGSMENKTKIVRLCHLFEKHYPNSELISGQLRQRLTKEK